jgi:hypothetical protein
MTHTNYPRFPHLDDAILGVTDSGELVYSGDRILDILAKRELLSRDEAQEYFSMKVRPLYEGPIVMWERLDVTLV